MAIGCLALLLAGLAVPAQADFMISIGDAANDGKPIDIAQGGTGTLYVWLTSTANSSSPDLLNNYAFELLISHPHFLQFVNPPDTSYASQPNYVFFGDSAGVSATVSPMNGPNDTFDASDSTASGNPVALSKDTTPAPGILLATIGLSAPTNSVNVGDSYTISLNPTSGNGSMFPLPSPPTFFDVFDFVGNNGETSHVPFTSTSGTVKITAASVPEPASIISGLVALACLSGLHGMRRFRRSKGHAA
jgi:hypothetical protein